MSRVYFFVSIAFLLGLLTASYTVSARPRPNRVIIQSDQAEGLARIIIEGREVGRFDKNGLHVVGNIDYTGALTDTAPTWLDHAPAQGEKSAK